MSEKPPYTFLTGDAAQEAIQKNNQEAVEQEQATENRLTVEKQERFDAIKEGAEVSFYDATGALVQNYTVKEKHPETLEISLEAQTDALYEFGTKVSVDKIVDSFTPKPISE